MLRCGTYLFVIPYLTILKWNLSDYKNYVNENGLIVKSEEMAEYYDTKMIS